MKLFNLEQFADLIKLLKRSKQNFHFDQESLKLRLLTRINSHHLPEGEKLKLRRVEFPHLQIYQYSAALAVILFATTGVTFAIANTAKPGDLLFPLDVFQEKMILSLPLSYERKAKLQSGFVSERIKELNQFKQISGHDAAKVTAVKESQKTLTQALEAVSQSRDLLESKGKNLEAEKLDDVLSLLETLAVEHEKNADEIKTQLDEPKFKLQIDDDLTEIKNARLKIKHEIRRQDGNKENEQRLQNKE